jgi:simple sugar transport system permease protein
MKGLGWKEAALVVGAAALVWFMLTSIGVVPGEAMTGLVRGSMGGPAAWRQTLREMTPLLIAGLAVAVALRAGLFNIGADGQLLVGAAAAAVVALAVPGPFGVVLACVAACAAGGLWAFPAGWIRVVRGGHEVISTIMLNNIAIFLTLWLVRGPIKDPSVQTWTTPSLPPGAGIPNLVEAGVFRLNWALPLAILGTIAFGVWLQRTVGGFELRTVGANLTASMVAGVDGDRIRIRAMVVSGALAGLAGAVLVLAFERRFYSNFSPGYGFDALGVALLAGSSAWGLLPSAFLFAALSAGTTSVQILGVPKGLSTVLLGLIIIVFAVFRYREARRVG